LHVVCPSVRLSVTLVDQQHINWKSWKLSAQTNSLTPSLSVAQRPPTYSHTGEHGEILERLEVGWGKVACWSTKAVLYLKRVKTDKKLLWRAYGNSPTLFRMVPSPTHYTASSSPRLGIRNPNPKLSGHPYTGRIVRSSLR